MGSVRGPDRRRVISILTDFGTVDGYVAAMKGVILGLNPDATLVDITHQVPPQDVRFGAFVLHTVHRYFPPGTVHLAVVDPGVGTERAGVILDTGSSLFVGPDNGLLSFVLAEGRRMVGQIEDLGSSPSDQSDAGARGGEASSVPRAHGPERAVPLPDGWRAVRIAEPRFWLADVSTTFHGRDIFAPVAAHLALGEPLESFGPPIPVLRSFPIQEPRRLPNGDLEGEVLHVDRFGNLITNLRGESLPRGQVVVELAGRRLQGLRATYAGSSDLVALVGSSGYLEIALPGGSAQAETGAGVGTPVRVAVRRQSSH